MAVSIGTAKPMPTLPPPEPPVSIWELMPITSPAALSSGPPELPGLIGASVCRTLSIENPFGAAIVRCSADITPVVSVVRDRTVADREHRIAHLRSVEPPGVSGWCRPSVGMRRIARSLEGSLPITLASTSGLFQSSTWTSITAVLDHVIVGENCAVAVDHDPRAGRLTLALCFPAAEQVERRGFAPAARPSRSRTPPRARRARRSDAASVPCSSARRSTARLERPTGRW